MKRVLTTLFILFLGLAAYTQTAFEAHTFTGKLRDFKTTGLDQSFAHYEIYEFSTTALNDYLQPNDQNQYEVRIQLGEKHQWDLFLFPNDIRGPEYQQRIASDSGIEKEARNPNFLYKGERANTGEHARLSITDNLLMGYVTIDKEEFFIEPLYFLMKDAPADYYILYKAGSVLKKAPATCGVKSIHKNRPKIPTHLMPENPDNDCKEIQLGLASDFELFEAMGSAADISMQTLTVTNMMEGIYISEFNLSYIVTDFFIATTNAADPWTNSLVSEDVFK